MATEKQIEANRANSLSAGVNTEEGKLRVRFNSFKHGLSSKVLISNFNSVVEAEDSLNMIFKSLCESLNPKNSLEEELVYKMSLSIFKTERCEALEKNSLKEELNIFTSRLEIEASPSLDTALKYKGSVENSFYRALDTLIKLRQVQQLDLFWKASNE